MRHGQPILLSHSITIYPQYEITFMWKQNRSQINDHLYNFVCNAGLLGVCHYGARRGSLTQMG